MKIFLAMLVVVGSLVVGGILVATQLPGYLNSLSPATKPSAVSRPHHRPAHGHAGQRMAIGPLPAAAARQPLVTSSHHGFGLMALALEWVVGSVVFWVIGVWVPVRRRLKRRRERDYQRYRITLSSHDEATPEDVEQMVAGLHGIVHTTATRWWMDGQPFLAFEMFYGPMPTGMGLTYAVVCEPRVIGQVAARITSAYPNVHVGHVSVNSDPVPLEGPVAEPAHILRLRKDRPFVYPCTEVEAPTSFPLWDEVAKAMDVAGDPCAVRVILHPTRRRGLERFVRWRTGRLEKHAERSSKWGLPEPGASSPLNREELQGVGRMRNRRMFWTEIQVVSGDAQASDDHCTAKTLAGVFSADRGVNLLRPRQMSFRRSLYQRRFPVLGLPLLPTPSWSLPTLCSSSEVAQLLRMPSGRLDLPFERTAIPRTALSPQGTQTHDTRRRIPPAAVHNGSGIAPTETAPLADRRLPPPEIAPDR